MHCSSLTVETVGVVDGMGWRTGRLTGVEPRSRPVIEVRFLGVRRSNKIHRTERETAVYLKIDHKALIEAADLGHVWRDGNVIYRSRNGNSNAGWSRTTVTRAARQLLAAEYLHESADGNITATEDGRTALRSQTPNRFPIVTARLA